MTLCQESSGFLFPHPCGRPSARSCGRCQKQVCPQHSRPWTPDAVLCLACVRLALDEPSSTIVILDDDPYFYRTRHYSHYHWYHSGHSFTSSHDPADFTDGDRGALDDSSSGTGGDFGGEDASGGDFGGDTGAS